MKLITKAGKSEKDILSLRREIDILRNLRHPNIIEMLDAFETQEDFCVVTEFAQGELFQVLEEDKQLPESVVRSIGQQLVAALYYLHSNRIIHRDMKPQNILVASDGTGTRHYFEELTFFASTSRTVLQEYSLIYIHIYYDCLFNFLILILILI